MHRRDRLVNSTVGAASLGAALAFAYREILILVAASESESTIGAHTAPHLVLALFLVMLVLRRAEIGRAVASPGRAWHACTLLVPSALILLWAHLQAATDLLFLSLALAVLGSSWLLGGALLCRTLLPAAGILLFAMPIPAVLRNQYVFALQNASAALTSGWLDVLNVTHARFGDILELGADSFQVVEECSGIVSIGALSLAAVFYSGLFRCTPLQAGLLIAVAPAIGLLANSFRVLWLTLGDPSGAREEHSLQGLAVIALGALALGVIDRQIGRLPAVKAKASHPTRRHRRLEGLPRQRVVLLCALFIAVGVSIRTLPPRVLEPGDAVVRVGRIAAALEEIESEIVETDLDFLGSTGFDAILHRRYRVDRHPVTLFVGVDDRSDRLVSGRSPKTVLPGPRWRVVDEEPLARSGSEAKVLEIENGAGRQLVHHWTAGFDSLASETRRSLIGLEPRRAAPQPGFVVRLSTPLRIGSNGPVEEAARLRSIAEKLEASLNVP